MWECDMAGENMGENGGLRGLLGQDLLDGSETREETFEEDDEL